jgi:hypothetical protein
MSQGEGGGRPTKYDPAYCDQLIAHMNHGYSFASFAGKCAISESTLYKWQADYPEFAEAHQIGIPCKRLELEYRLLNGDPKATTAAIFALKCAFPEEWADKRQVEQTGTLEIVWRGRNVSPKSLTSSDPSSPPTTTAPNAGPAS